MGYHPSETELKKISEYTGGWISMVYLTLLGIEQGIPAGKSDVIDKLVEKALFNTYDDSIRRFLLRLSAMDVFTAGQALFVTEEPNAEELLKQLRRENAFISYDPAAGVYRIHNVLLDFLRIKHKTARNFRIFTGGWANGFLLIRQRSRHTAISAAPGIPSASSGFSTIQVTSHTAPLISRVFSACLRPSPEKRCSNTLSRICNTYPC